MTEYIERKIALSIREPSKSDRHYQTYNLDDAYGQGWDDALCCIESIPVADVAPIRHGHWIRVSLIGVFECSECGNQITAADGEFAKKVCKWCLHCGAKMDEEVSE